MVHHYMIAAIKTLKRVTGPGGGHGPRGRPHRAAPRDAERQGRLALADAHRGARVPARARGARRYINQYTRWYQLLRGFDVFRCIIDAFRHYIYNAPLNGAPLYNTPFYIVDH